MLAFFNIHFMGTGDTAGREDAMKQLLLADPNRDLLRCYAALLGKRGYAVTTAFDGTQVIEKTAETGFDLALLGSALPRIGVEKLIPLLHDRQIPVLLLTAEDGDCGADASLAFPFLPQEVYVAVERLLGKDREGETA